MDEMSHMLTLAKKAGAAILLHYRNSEREHQGKADGSPLTAADLAANQVIVDGLSHLTPELPVLSEESSIMSHEKRLGWRRFWLVDPLDGTKEFIKRNGEFTVNIALIEDGLPVMGVVHAPVLDVTYFAARGDGAFMQQGDAPPSPIRCILHVEGKPMKVVASRSHSDERTTELLARLGGHECISMGSSLKLCLVAEGKAHLYPRLGPTMEWDTAAAHAVVSEAGGVVVDSMGNELQYNKPDLHNPEFFVCHQGYRSNLSRLLSDKE